MLKPFYHYVNSYQSLNYKSIELLDELFTEQLLSKENLIYAPINSFSELYTRINENYTPIEEEKFDLYSNIKIVKDSIFNLNGYNIIKITFSLNNRIYNSYNYFNNFPQDTAFLILPGSDPNQSYAIVSENNKNYHYGFYTKFKNRYGIFVYIKPNEDILAWHNGSKKINGYAYYNTLISWGPHLGILALYNQLQLLSF